MPSLIEELRKNYPEFDVYSDEALVKAAAPAFKGDFDKAASYFGIERNDPGITTDIRRNVGQMGGLMGSSIRSLREIPGAETVGRGLQKAGDDLAFRNPGEIHSLQDIIDRPGTTAREAVGEMLPQEAASTAATIAGAGIGARAGMAAGALFTPVAPGLSVVAGGAIGGAIGGIVGRFGYSFMQEYGTILDGQKEAGNPENRGRAALLAIPAAALDTLIGPEANVAKAIARKGRTELTAAAARQIAEKGALKYGAQQVVKQGAIEGSTEFVQTGLERAGAGQDLLSKEALDDYAVSTIKAGIGGSALGGPAKSLERVGLRSKLRQMDANLDNPDAPMAEQLKAADTRQEFMVNESGRKAADQWHAGHTWQAQENNTARGLMAGQAADLMAKNEVAAKAAEQKAADNIGFDNDELPGVHQPINPYDVGGHVSRFLKGESTGVDTPQMGLFGGAGDASSVSGGDVQHVSWVSPITGKEVSLVMPHDPGSAIGAINQVHAENGDRAIPVGTPIHGLLLRANEILKAADLAYNPDEALAAGEKAPGKDAKVATALTATPPAGPPGSAIAAFHEKGGKRGAWAKFVGGVTTPEQLLAKLEAKVGSKINGNAEPWIAAYEAIKPKEQANASQQSGGNVLPVQQAVPVAGATGSPVAGATGSPVAQPGGVPSVVGAVGQNGQGGVAVPEARQVTAVDVAKLPAVQRKVLSHMIAMVADHRIDEVIDEGGTMEFAKIAEALGIKRGSVHMAVNGALKALAAAQGMTVDEMKEGLRKTGQKVAVAAESKLGLSPSAQDQHLDASVFGSAEGAESDGTDPSMSKIDSPNQTHVVEDYQTAKDTEAANAEAAKLMGMTNADAAGKLLAKPTKSDGVQTVEEQKIEAKRQAAAEKERREFEAKAHEILDTGTARVIGKLWDDLKGSMTPSFASLHWKEKFDLMMAVDETQHEGDHTDADRALAAEAVVHKFEAELEMLNEYGAKENRQIAAPSAGAVESDDAGAGKASAGVLPGPGRDSQSEPVVRRKPKRVVAGSKPNAAVDAGDVAETATVVAEKTTPEKGGIAPEMGETEEAKPAPAEKIVKPEASEADRAAEIERLAAEQAGDDSRLYSELPGALAAAVAKWKGVVAEFFGKTLDRTKLVEMFGSTPAIMQVLGFPNLPVRGSAHIFDSHFNHGLTRSQLEALPAELADAQLVYVHTQPKLSINFVTRMMTNGEFIEVALEPNKDDVSGKTNYIATVTQRSHGSLLKAVREGRALYAGESKMTGLQEALTLAKRTKGREASELRAFIAKNFSYNQPAPGSNKVLHKSDLVKMVQDGKAEFSEGQKPANPSTAKGILATLSKAFFSSQRLNQLVTVYETQDEAKAAGRLSQDHTGLVQGFVHNGHVYLIAENIAGGGEMAVALHEIGVHLGMERLVGKEGMTRLHGMIQEYAARNDGSLESKVAKEALERAEQSSSGEANRPEEAIAYFVEGAVNAGVNPTAATRGEFGQWFRTLWAAAKAALRALGFKNPQLLTAQQFVNLAMGAARLEVTGNWHGTAAVYRKVSSSKVLSGEGAAAYGHGALYAAQRQGIGEEYRQADVERKARGRLYELRDSTPLTPEEISHLEGVPGFGRAIKYGADGVPEVSAHLELLRHYKTARNNSHALIALYEKVIAAGGARYSVKGDFLSGALLRVDHAAQEHEYLDWDKPIGKEIADKILANLNEYAASVFPDEVMEQTNLDPEEIKGGELYKILMRMAGETPLGKRDMPHGTSESQDVSGLLEAAGLKGVRFLDARSRDDSIYSVRQSKNTYGSPALRPAHDGMWYVRDGVSGAPLQAKYYETEAQANVALQKILGRQESRRTRNYVLFNDKEIVRAVSYLGGRDRGTKGPAGPVKFSEAPKSVAQAASVVGGASAKLIVTDTSHTLKKMAFSLAYLHDLVEEFKGRVPAIGRWYDAVQASITTRKQLENDAEKIAAAADKLKGGTARVNEFLSRSTFEQKWGYDPKFAGRNVTVDPQMAIAFRALSTGEQQVVRAIFAHGEKMAETKRALVKELNLPPMFAGSGKLEGPYAPLKRFGNYLGILKSAELVQAEKDNNAKRVEELKSDPTHYVSSSFDTMGQAKQFADANAHLFKGGRASASEAPPRVAEGKMLPEAVLRQVMSAVRMNDDVPAAAREAMLKMVQDMYLASLDQHNARTSGMKRLNRAGYDTDMVRSFLSHARSEAGFLANMKHGGEINDQFYQMGREAKDENDNPVHQDLVNTIAAHYAENLNYKETPWQDRAMALTSAWQLATSVGYHVTNATQGFMVTVPKLAADFGNYTGAWSALLDGYKVLKDTGMWGNINLSKVKNEGLRAALQKAADMGVLDVGMDEDLTHFEQMRTGHAAVDTASKVAKNALHKLRQVSRAVETANRISSATAGYNMSIASGKSVEEAQAYAVRLLRDTQGDFSRVGSPLLLKRLPKAVTQYRKYQFMMAALYVKAYRDAFHGADAETKAVGRRMLAFKLFHTSVAAGALGMPLANLAALVFSAMGGDDEPEDLERWLREQIGDEDLANLVLHGLPAYFGLDMNAKLGENNIFSIMPYGTWDFSSASGLAKTAMSLAGPAASQAGRVADGVGQMAHGDYYKGLEKFMPKGVESAMRAFRVANEGYTLKNGDVMVQPEDISGMTLALDAIGMPTTELKRYDWLRSQQYEIGRFFIDRTKAIEHDYARAVKEGDDDATSQLREDWMDLQAGKDNVRGFFNDSSEALKKQPLSNLLRYPETAAKREKKLQQGIPK